MVKIHAFSYITLGFLIQCIVSFAGYSQPKDIKWYPGHYVFVGNRTTLESRVEEVSNFSIIRGFQLRYFWNEMEPSRDNYDFSMVLNDLNYLQSKDKFLVIQIQFKSFNSNDKPYPAYIQTPNFDGGIYESSGGWNLRLWNDSILVRFQALISALGEATNNHPGLVLVNTAESAASTPLEQSLASTWSSLSTQHSRNLASCGRVLRAAFPNTPTLTYFNGGNNVVANFESIALETGQGHGGPDTYIGAYEKNLFLRHGYNLGQRLAGKVPIGYGVQWNNFIWVGASSAHADPRGAVPPVEHYEFSKDVLKSNFMFWDKREPYWEQVKAFWLSLSPETDPAGGMHSQLPQLLASPLDVDQEAPDTGMLQVFPNPFSSGTNIQFTVRELNHVGLSIFNLSGEKVLSLVNQVMEAGSYNFQLDSLHLPVGVYILKMRCQQSSMISQLMVKIN